MRLGINGSALVAKASISAFRQDVQRAIDDGFSSYWIAEHPTGGLDALTVITALAEQSAKIELGTAIVPTWPRHPMILAGQALSTATAMREETALSGEVARSGKTALSGETKLTLGIGLSHKVMMAELGIKFDKPILHLREYLSILMPLIESGEVNFSGELFSTEAKIFRPPENDISVVVAALGPQALRVAGSRTDGTTLAWVGAKTIREHIAPNLSDAAAKAGRAAPRIIATLPVCVTETPEQHAAMVSKNLAMYGQLPSYKAMFEREGVTEPGELALLGSAAQVEDKLNELKDAGVTDFGVSLFATSKDEHVNTKAMLKQFMAKS